MNDSLSRLRYILFFLSILLSFHSTVFAKVLAAVSAPVQVASATDSHADMTAVEGGVYVTWVRNPDVLTGIGEIYGRFISFDGVLYPEQKLAQVPGFAPRAMWHGANKNVVILYADQTTLYLGRFTRAGVPATPWQIAGSGLFDSPNSFCSGLDLEGRTFLTYTLDSNNFAAAGFEPDGSMFAYDDDSIPIPPAMVSADARYTLNAMNGESLISVYNDSALGFYRFDGSGLVQFDGFVNINALGMARPDFNNKIGRVLFSNNFSGGYDFNYGFYDPVSGNFINNCVPLIGQPLQDGTVPLVQRGDLAYAGYYRQEPGSFALYAAAFNGACNSFFDVRMEQTFGSVNIPYPNKVIAAKKLAQGAVLAPTRVKSPPQAEGIFTGADLSDFIIVPLANFPSASLIVDIMDNDQAAFLIADTDALNGSGNLYVVFEGVIAPTDLKGCKKSNRFLSQIDNYNQLSWTLSSSSQTTGYRIYRNGCLIATVNATTACYQDHTVCGVNTYQVKAVDAQGNESQPITIKI